MPEKDPLDDELLRELGLEPHEVEASPEESFEEAPDEYAPEPEPEEAHHAQAVAQPAEPASRPAQPRYQAPTRPDENFRENTRQLVSEMPIQVVAVLGKKTMSLSEVLELKAGEVLDLRKLPQEMVDLVANGRLIARGELVLVDGKVGIQIKKVVAS